MRLDDLFSKRYLDVVVAVPVNPRCGAREHAFRSSTDQPSPAGNLETIPAMTDRYNRADIAVLQSPPSTIRSAACVTLRDVADKRAMSSDNVRPGRQYTSQSGRGVAAFRKGHTIRPPHSRRRSDRHTPAKIFCLAASAHSGCRGDAISLATLDARSPL